MGNKRIRCSASVANPVIIHMASCCPPVYLLACCTQRTFSLPPGFIGHGHITVVGRPGVDIRISSVVIITKYHGCGSGRAAITPVKGRNIGKCVCTRSFLWFRDYGRPCPINWRRTARNDDLINPIALVHEPVDNIGVVRDNAILIHRGGSRYRSKANKAQQGKNEESV